MLDSITLLHTQGQYIYICISKVSVNLKKKKKYSIIITDSLVHKMPTYNVMNFFCVISAKTNSINFLVIKQISFL